MWCGAIAVQVVLNVIALPQSDDVVAEGADAVASVAASATEPSPPDSVDGGQAAPAQAASPAPASPATASSAGRIALATEIIGFDDAGIQDATRRLKELLGAEGLTSVDVDVGDACAEVPACVAEAISAEAKALVRVSALRVGGDVEVRDTVSRRDGSVVAEETRLLSVDAFLQAPLSPSVLHAIRQAKAQSSSSPTTPASGPVASDASLPIGTIVTLGGGAVAALGLMGFAAEAGTLDNPRSLGADKERAQVSTWVFLGVAAVGLGAAGAGVVMGMSD